MKKQTYFVILLSFLLLNGNLFSQSRKDLKEQSREKEIVDEIFENEDDPLFKITEIPEKWKDESAVVIYQKYDYSYLKRNAGHSDIEEIVRKRIKLNDKSAVEDFSEFYYEKDADTKVVGIKIIKESGKVEEVDVSDAIVVGSRVPRFFQSIQYSPGQYAKIAVPNLEPGDIIDYFFVSINNKVLTVKNVPTDFSPFLFQLNSTYPIMNQKFTFTMDRDFYINFGASNGAPQLTEGEPYLNYRGVEKKSIRTYELIDKDREKIDDERYLYINRIYPTIKFQVLYCADMSMSESANFYGTKGEVNTSIDTDELLYVTSLLVKLASTAGYSSYISNSIKKIIGDERDKDKIVKHAYYAFRYYFLAKHYGCLFEDMPTSDPYNQYPTLNEQPVVSISDEWFFGILYNSLKKYRLGKIIVATPKTIGDIDDVVLKDELVIGLKYGDLYFFPFNNYIAANEIPYSVEGTEALEITLGKNADDDKVEKIILPESSYNDNVMETSMDITIDEGMENLGFDVVQKKSGKYKSNYWVIAAINADYIKSDKKKYNPDYKPVKNTNSYKYEEHKRKKQALYDENYKLQKDYLKADLEDEFHVVSYDEFELVDAGRFDDNPCLEYKEKYVLSGLINKVGPNYLLEAGKLIGGQVELEEKEMTRKNDIYMDYQRTILNKINIKVPEGYTVEGIDKLNINVDNDMGSFVSTAKMEGNQLVIETRKIYKKTFAEKENWDNLVKMLEAAYHFTQQKVMLKKV